MKGIPIVIEGDQRRIAGTPWNWNRRKRGWRYAMARTWESPDDRFRLVMERGRKHATGGHWKLFFKLYYKSSGTYLTCGTLHELLAFYVERKLENRPLHQ